MSEYQPRPEEPPYIPDVEPVFEPERDYNDDDLCTLCGSHLSEPHAPNCPRVDLEDGDV